MAVQLVLLGIQLLVGMAVNLWAAIPHTHPGVHSAHYVAGRVQGITWALVHGGTLVTVHIVIAFALWLLSLGLIAATWRPRRNGLFSSPWWPGWVSPVQGLTEAAFLTTGTTLARFS